VRTEVKDQYDPTEPLQVRVFVGNRSAAFRVNGPDIDHVSSDGAVRMKVERLDPGGVVGGRALRLG